MGRLPVTGWKAAPRRNASPIVHGIPRCGAGTGSAFQWLEWSGHVTLRPVSGISLWDLSFRGQRIVYELSLQELFIAYNSYSGAGATYFLVPAPTPPAPRPLTTRLCSHPRGQGIPERAGFAGESRVYSSGHHCALILTTSCWFCH